MKIVIIMSIFIFSIFFVSSLIPDTKYQTKECKLNCKEDYKNFSQQCKFIFNLCKENCTDIQCKKLCSYDKSSCIKQSIESYNLCKEDCSPYKGCLNNTIKVNEKFARDCDICECKKNDKLKCKKDNFCNKNITISESLCSQSGGFYNALCNGPYFDIVCSQQKFCLCEGNFNYSCPESFFCLKNFISPNKRDATIGGWKTLLGYALGDVGVCAR